MFVYGKEIEADEKKKEKKKRVVDWYGNQFFLDGWKRRKIINCEAHNKLDKIRKKIKINTTDKNKNKQKRNDQNYCEISFWE